MILRKLIRSGIAGAFLVAAGSFALTTHAFAEAKEFRVAKQYGLGFLPLMVMESEGFFDKRAAELKLDVKANWMTFGGPAAMNEALLSNNVDVVSNGPPSFLIMWNRTLNSPLSVRAIAPLSQLPMWLMSRNPNIKSLTDFTDKDRVAVTAVKTSIPSIIMQMWAAKKWGDENYQRLDSLTTSLPHPDAMAALLSNTEVSAHFASPPYQYSEQKKGLHRVATSYELMGSPATFSVTYATNAFAKANPKIMEAFYKAMMDSHKFINENHERATDIYLKLARESSTKDQVLEILADKDVKFTATPHSFMTYAKFMNKVGTLKSVPSDWRELFFEYAHDTSGD
jgi:ABC-type nitrate/sulfonate/bicarbonate transport system substrate-binding protein